MKILKERFCGLSKSRDFQAFLRSIADDLYSGLLKQLQLGEGCTSNKRHMIKVYEEIKSRGLTDKLEEFLLNRHPYMMIKETNKDKKKEELAQAKQDNEVIKIEAKSMPELYDKMNHHSVFHTYRPRIFSVPQRRIFVDTSEAKVRTTIEKFIKGKLNTDYLVLEGPDLWHGYVEYFDARFVDSVKEVDHSQRPIAIYKRKNKIK